MHRADTAMVNEMPKGKRRLPAVLLAVIILLLSAYMVYWGTQKAGYYIDDMYTMMDVAGGRPYRSEDFFNTWHNASRLKSAIVVSSEDAFSSIRMHGDFISYLQDVSSNSYLKLLHTAYSFTPDEFTIWPSVVLNTAFFIGILIVIYGISRIFIKNEYMALLPVLVYGVSSAAVNMVLLIRSYPYKVLICMILVYAVFKLILSDFKKWRYLIVILLSVAIGVTIHQYFFVFTFFLALFVCIYLAVRKKWKPLLIFAGSMGAMAIYTLFISRSLYEVLTNPDTSYGMAALRLLHGTDDFPERIVMYADFVSKLAFGGIPIFVVFLLGLFMMAVLLMAHKDNKEKMTEIFHSRESGLLLVSFGTCVMYLLTIARITPGALATERYMFCITPLIAIMFISLLTSSLKAIGIRNKIVVFIAIAVLHVVMFTFGFVDIHLYRGDKAINKTLEEYHHLPAVCLSVRESGPAFYFWQLFELENKAFFAVGGDVDYDIITENTFEEGLLLVIDSRLESFDEVITNLFDATGLSGYTHVATLDRFVPFHYYVLT